MQICSSYFYDATYVSFSINKALLEEVSLLLFIAMHIILLLKGYYVLHCME